MEDASAAVTLTNVTISGNDAVVDGGGIHTTDGPTLTVINSTITDNEAGGVGGGVDVSSGGSHTLRNTIVAGNTAGDSGDNCEDTITNGGYNIDSGTTCGWGSNNGSMSDTDPLLDALADNGGPTQTHALRAGSPALDAIPEGGNSYNGAPATDQRGVPRPQPTDGNCDIGAYEGGQSAIVIEKHAGCDGVSGTFTFEIPNLTPGTYSITEGDPAPGFDLTAITCDDGASANPSSGDLGTRTATYELDPNETVTCAFTNAYVPPVIIGGVILPVDKSELLALWLHPSTLLRTSSERALWMGLTALAALTVALVRRRRA